MRAVVQRVKRARVEVRGRVAGEIGSGLLVFVGVGLGDSEKDGEYIADKAAHLRVFPDEHGRMNRSVVESGGSILVVSQFTLWGDCRKGRRPSFVKAEEPERAKELYEYVISSLERKRIRVASGEFQEMMDVHLVNDGPVTLILDSKRSF